ncbi:MAG: Crp/Fnr family transcriptional regulator [Nitrospirae bacterium]|nr:Crp/Fnr family transcriptional regulator [Nitrospirota bacterium]MCL5285125.1 Crp/Fnr family transcriptional regulator [Nitrospirota bacterium]
MVAVSGKVESVHVRTRQNNVDPLLPREPFPLTNRDHQDVYPLRETLEGIPLFHGLPVPLLEQISSFSRIRNYRSSHRIIQANDLGSELFLVLSGSVKVSIEDREGREIILAVVYPPDFFGEVSLWDNGTRTANVSALEATRVVAIEKEPFLRLIREYPEITLRLLSALSARLRETDGKLMHMAYGDAYEKVSRTLFGLFEKEGETDGGVPFINDRFTRQELASLSGVSRETVSRSLGAFVQAGILRIGNGRIYILNIDRLKKEGRIP